MALPQMYEKHNDRTETRKGRKNQNSKCVNFMSYHA